MSACVHRTDEDNSSHDDRCSPDDASSQDDSHRAFALDCLVALLKERDSDTASASSSTDIAELDDEFDSKLCQLWDLSSSEPAIGECLLEEASLKTILITIELTNKPRLAEILVGILANLVCQQSTLDRLIHSESVRTVIVQQLACRDSGVLTETVRFLTGVLSADYSAWSSFWERSLFSAESVGNFSFILRSSTNEALLTRLADFLDDLFDHDESCQALNTCLKQLGVAEDGMDFAGSILEAITTIVDGGSPEVVATFLHVLQALSTCEAGCEILNAANASQLWSTTTLAVRAITLRADVSFDIDDTELSVLACSLSLWCFLASSSCKLFLDDVQVFDELDEVFTHVVDCRERELAGVVCEEVKRLAQRVKGMIDGAMDEKSEKLRRMLEKYVLLMDTPR